MRKILLCLLALISYVNGFGSNKPQTPAMKIGFVPNKGQISSGILYAYKGQQLDVHLRKNGFSYSLIEGTIENSPLTLPIDFSEYSDIKIKQIDIDLLGSNPNIQYQESEVGAGELIYRSPQNIENAITVNHYRKVLYRNVYPNIDIEFIIDNEGNESKGFKYNFILHPGADPAQIQLKIKGADQTKINKNGALQMLLGKGLLEERIPLSYEQTETGDKGKIVDVSYRKIGLNVFGLSIGRHAKSKTIVVDPIAWSTYFGGSSTEYTQGLITDVLENLYVVGRTQSTTGIATTGAMQQNFAQGSGTFDAFVAKFDSSGALKWATYFGGTGDEMSTDITLDKFGNIIIVGNTSSASGIATSFGLQPAISGGTDGFITKYTNYGGMLWSTYFGYSINETLLAVGVDYDNDVYVSGISNSNVTLFPGVYQFANAGNYDGIIAKISGDGLTLKNATYFGGSLSEYINGIAVDQAKNIYFSGYTSSTSGIATPGATKQVLIGGIDGVYGRFDSSLTKLVFATYYGGNGSDYIFDLSLDGENKMVMTGFTSSSSGIATTGANQTTYGGGTYDGMLIRSDSNGTLLWSTYVGGVGDDYSYAICSDPSSNIYSIGVTTTTSSFSTPNAFQSVYGGGGNDAFISKFDKGGNSTWISYFGGSGNDIGREICFHPSGDLFFGGETYSADGLATSGAHQVVLGGTVDAFISRFIQVFTPGAISNNTISSNQILCLGNTAQTLVGTAPSGGNGIYSYRWISSNTGFNGSFAPASGPNTGSSYSPGILLANKYFKRVVTSGTYIDTSNMLSITVSNLSQINAGFTVNKSIQCLKNNQFIFSDTTSNTMGNLTHFWDFGNGKTSTNPIDTVSYIASVDNLFKVRLITSMNGGCADTTEQNIILINNPQVKTVIGPDSVMKGTTTTYNTAYTNGSSYIWSFGKGTGNSSTISINIKWTSIGDDTIKMLERNGGGCYGDTVYKLVYVKQPTGTEEFGLNQSLLVYPNPGEGIFKIETESQESFKFDVFDMSGKCVYSEAANTTGILNLSAAPEGLYILQVSNAQGETLHRKLQIIR